VAEIFTVSSKVFSREAGVVAITTKSHFVNDLQSSLAKCTHCVPYSGPNKRNKPFDVRTELSMIAHSQVSPSVDTQHAPVRLCHHVHLVVGAIITLELHAGSPTCLGFEHSPLLKVPYCTPVNKLKRIPPHFDIGFSPSMAFFWLHKFEVQGSILTPSVLLILARAKSHPQWYQLP
jgi:hypothetical protein